MPTLTTEAPPSHARLIPRDAQSRFAPEPMEFPPGKPELVTARSQRPATTLQAPATKSAKWNTSGEGLLCNALARRSESRRQAGLTDESTISAPRRVIRLAIALSAPKWYNPSELSTIPTPTNNLAPERDRTPGRHQNCNQITHIEGPRRRVWTRLRNRP